MAFPTLTLPAGRGGKRLAAASLLISCCLTACTTAGIPYAPGTPEYAAALVSRGYDCGVRVDRAGVSRPLSGDERRRFVRAGQELSVKAYNAPRGCSAVERASVQHELRSLAARRQP
jgi:hypothetical protein